VVTGGKEDKGRSKKKKNSMGLLWKTMKRKTQGGGTRVRRIRLKNLFASKRIEANLDLIRLIFACFMYFANLIYSLYSLIFA
jgi:hypothetical protein